MPLPWDGSQAEGKPVRPVLTDVKVEDLKRKGRFDPPKTEWQEHVYFWNKIEVLRDCSVCWEWKLNRDAKLPYGKTRWAGGQTTAHRVAYLMAYGSLSPVLDVMHICDNPPCCNPNHLHMGTTRENILDATSKGRWTVKLNPELVRQIRAKVKAGGEQQRIAFSLGLSKTTIHNVVAGKTWEWVV